MPTSPIHIGRLINWFDLLQILGTPAPVNVLPHLGLCPVCSKQKLHMFADTVNFTQWYFCESCKQSGDLVQLAQRTWKLDLSLTINKLWNELPELKVYHVPSDAVSKYERLVVGTQLQAKEFWQIASSRLINGVGLRQLRLAMDISTGMTAETWAKTGGQFIGSATQEELCAVVDHREKSGALKKGKDDDSVQWQSLLVIPFWDAPEHISALLIYRENKAGLAPILYHQVGSIARRYHPMPLAGLAMFSALFNSKADRGFVFLDPLLAARTHMKHYSVGDTTLPIVAIWPATQATTIVRDISPSRELIFFDHTLTPDLIRHAQMVNGKVVWDTTGQGIYKYSRRLTAADWLDKLQREAKPWDVVLEEHLSKLSAADVEKWLILLRWTTQQLESYIASCTPDVRTFLQAVFTAQMQKKREIQLDSHRVYETVRGWTKNETGELITDTPFKIERIINYQVTKQVLYEGVINYKGQSIPFLADKAVFDRRPLWWVDTYLIKKGIGSTDFSYTWERAAVTIAKRFYPPKDVQGIANYGWNNSDASFYFPTFTVGIDGAVTSHELPIPDFRAIPAKHLTEPVDLTTAEIKQLSKNNPETQALWSIFTCVIHNLLAPVYVYPTSGIVLIDGLGALAVELPPAFGCPRIPTFVLGSRAEEDKLDADEERAVWPVFFEGQARRGYAISYWLNKSVHNCVVDVDWYTSRILAVKGGWLRIQNMLVNKVTPEIINIAKKMVPIYIKHLAKNRWHRQTGDISQTVAQVSFDICEWFSGLHGDINTARYGCNLIEHDYKGSRADAFFQLIQRLYEQGTIGLRERSEYGMDRKKVKVCIIENRVWIPKPGLNIVLAKNTLNASMLDIASVTQALSESGELQSESIYRGTPCWVVDKKVWLTRMKVLQLERYAKQKELT